MPREMRERIVHSAPYPGCRKCGARLTTSATPSEKRLLVTILLLSGREGKRSPRLSLLGGEQLGDLAKSDLLRHLAWRLE